MSIDSFREKVNLKIFSSKDLINRIFRFFSFLVSLVSIITIVYHYGYSQTPEEKHTLLSIIKGCLGFFVLNYLIRFLYTFEPLKFFRESRVELILVIILMVDGISYFVFGFPLAKSFLIAIGLENHTWIYFLVIQIFLVIIVMIELAKATATITNIKISAQGLFILSFVMLISMGAFLLMMPEMTVDHKGAPFLTALFTSISASCVTGLIVVDTATYFTLKGQFLIMVLFQIGGLSIISFATFFASFAVGGVGIKHTSMIQDFLSSDSLMDTKGLLRQIIFLSILIEVSGTIMIFMLWDPNLEFTSFWSKAFYSVFHAISAFNNAGFSLFTNGLMENGVQNSYILHLVIAVLIFMGSLGFYAIRDLWGVKNMRNRLKIPWKKIKLSTAIALYSSIALIIIGTIAFYFLERDGVLAGQKSVAAVITSIFQSVTTRTAGFNTVDISQLKMPTLILIIFLMFIGASSGSTGGGIKTSTFTLILLSAYSTIRGKRNLHLRNNTISFELLNRAFTIFLFASTFILFSTFILSITDPDISAMPLTFEAVSAFGTVGLSTGITASLSDEGKIVIMILMFVGRIGTLTLAFALSKKVVSNKFKYPKAHLMVG